MKISLIQTSPQTDKAENLRITRGLMEDAVRTDSPDLIVLPEYFEYYGGTPEEKLAAAESAPGGAAYKMAQDFAREHKVFVHAGTLMEKVPNEKRIYNSTFVFNREGKEIAHYRKIHMFDIVGPDGTAYKESATVKPGENVVVYDLDGFKIGCAICYDIRFAELYLELEKAGADVIVLPAAFTLQTGKDHWEVLARARAIETQTYFAACGQTGSTVSNGERRHTYGHSLVCDPWGHVVARASDGVGFVTARIERAQIERVRSLIPMVSHRRIGKQLQACA
ncbi:carbon-nitrogen hydrolase family protein (plasmid) [Ochrobactrum quorumnocens]|uniref:Carbon-nitrogen hydrolase family protein n=1 Tax=Ochrobactrum quorumnocens TaxID=271865 RepID=A0A248UN31_9HYPH|nr:carbon-nitrogen hydrolase family protein [[Ochrobactrum] quorumnocens]ASV88257.1 carbon-nitrogen hydrolase family protein [[Ochrobactrum] quorumnocens]